MRIAAVTLSLLAVSLLAPCGAARADAPFHAGYLTLTAAADPPVPVSVWYPTSLPETPFRAGPFTIDATRDAPVAPGRRRLVVISHGTLGSDLGHRDLAEFLARFGLVVAAPRHLGDSYDQPQGQGTDVQMIGRPWQIVATLDAVLADPRLAPAIDPARIGMAGFSAGGYTTLVIAGAVPRFTLWQEHCAAHPGDRELCRGGAADTVAMRMTRPGWTLPHETRVKAAVAMAPVGVFFDAAGLAGIDIPLRLLRGDGRPCDRECLEHRSRARLAAASGGAPDGSRRPFRLPGTVPGGSGGGLATALHRRPRHRSRRDPPRDQRRDPRLLRPQPRPRLGPCALCEARRR